MKEIPYFSIVTITYNAENSVEKTIRSAVSQSSKDYEYIIIDGKSSDRTMDIVRKYDRYIDTIVSESDKGIYDAMNKGLNYARGKYIVYMNSDDEFADEYVLEDIKKASADRNYDIIYGNAKLIYKSENRFINHKIKFNSVNLKRGFMPCHQSMYVSIEKMKEVGIYDTKYKLAGDFEMGCRLEKANSRVLYLDRDVANYSKGGKSSDIEIGFNELYKIIKEYWGNKAALSFKIRKQYWELNRKKVLKKLKLDSLARKIFLVRGNKI